MKMIKGYVWLYEIHNTKTDKKRIFIVNAKDLDNAFLLISNYEFGEESYYMSGWLKRIGIRLGIFSPINIETEEIVYVTEVKEFQRIGKHIQECERYPQMLKE